MQFSCSAKCPAIVRQVLLATLMSTELSISKADNASFRDQKGHNPSDAILDTSLPTEKHPDLRSPRREVRTARISRRCLAIEALPGRARGAVLAGRIRRHQRVVLRMRLLREPANEVSVCITHSLTQSLYIFAQVSWSVTRRKSCPTNVFCFRKRKQGLYGVEPRFIIYVSEKASCK